MKYYVALFSIFLILAYTAIVGIFYKDRFETDLASKAQDYFSRTQGLENVRVEFRSFDAFLSGEVPSSEHRQTAVGFITSLPAARLVSDRIVYPGLGLGLDPGPAEIPAPALPAPPPPPPPPPPKMPPSLIVSSSGESLDLSGAVPDITIKSSFLRAIALSGEYPDIRGDSFAIDPQLADADWPAGLPGFIAFLLTRTNSAEFAIDGERVAIAATALDATALGRIQDRLVALDFGDREQTIDLTSAPEIEIPDDAFFLKGTLSGEKLDIAGRFASAKARDRLSSVLATDLPDLEIETKIDIADGLDAPAWTARLPNLLSLVCSRTRDARITAATGSLTLIGEMDHGQTPEDLHDILSLMIGADVEIESHLLALDQSFIEDPPPAPADPEVADPGSALEN